VPQPGHAHEAVPVEGLGTNLRACAAAHHTQLQVHFAATQGPAVLVGLLQEVDSHPRCLAPEAIQKGQAVGLHEPIPGPQGERARQAAEVQLLSWLQNQAYRFHQGAHLFPQGQGPGSRHQPASRPHQQRVLERFPQPGQGAAHGRGAELQAPGGPGHLAFFQEGLQGEQQVEVGQGHASHSSRDDMAFHA